MAWNMAVSNCHGQAPQGISRHTICIIIMFMLETDKSLASFIELILQKYFASSDPHHGIQFIPSDILSDKSSDILSGISIWHSIWHVFWHSIWHIFWHSIRHIFWHSIWNIFWHSIWHIFWHSIWHSLWHFIWLCFWPLRSGWGPARPTACRISPVWGPARPTARGSRRLRSGEARSAQTLAGWGPARPTAIESWQWRSSEAHSDRVLAVGVRQGPRRSSASC